jgi:hypothetical protein
MFQFLLSRTNKRVEKEESRVQHPRDRHKRKAVREDRY